MASVTTTVWNDLSYWSEPAEQAFAKARRKARRESRANWFRSRQSTLMPFEKLADRLGLLPESHQSRRSVPLVQIVGSVGKSELFTNSFLPRSDRLVSRWKRAFAVAHGLEGYEPIELYEAAGDFYIVDGHFRVSVAKALGYETIQATVRRWV